MNFYKYQGTGNDFVILDNREGKISLSKEQIHKTCDRRFGIGADGLMLLNSKEGYDFEMKYYNSDGAESSMCGNGGRCMVRFAYDLGLHQDYYKFVAIDCDHEAEFGEKNWVNLKMKDVRKVTEDAGDFILDTGSPHYVKIVNDVLKFPVVESGRRIRYSDKYNAEGINVNFVQMNNEAEIFVRTYERGVEDETLSCGTGVTASALICAHNEMGFNRVEVHTPGGNLAVEFDRKSDQLFEDIWLCGPAEFVFKGEIQLK